MQAEMAQSAESMGGQRVVIVGASGEGIGRAVTRAVAAAGAQAIAIISRDADGVATAAAEVKNAGRSALGFVVDVHERDAGDRAIAAAVEAFGGVDTLVTVVGGYVRYARWTSLDQTADEDWDRILDLNLGYVFRFVRAALRAFIAQDGGGTIVAVGSLAGVDGCPKAAAYGVAKAGLINLAKTVSSEYGRREVRMNVVNSGLVDTQGGQAGISSGIDVSAVPLGRIGIPDDIARAVVFLASPASAYISGQALNVDGAVSARSPLGTLK